MLLIEWDWDNPCVFIAIFFSMKIRFRFCMCCFYVARECVISSALEISIERRGDVCLVYTISFLLSSHFRREAEVFLSRYSLFLFVFFCCTGQLHYVSEAYGIHKPS